MKLLLVFLVFTRIFFAQDSYEFKEAMPPNAESILIFNYTCFGIYESEETGTQIIVDANGISMLTVIHSYITRDQVRESSKYQIRNGYLFGVIEGDSVPYIEDEKRFYFGIRTKTILGDEKNKVIFKKINESSYIMNFPESKGYSPSLISFEKNSLSIRHFDYPSDGLIFKYIKNSENYTFGGMNHVSLDPSEKEFEKLNQKVIFGKEIVYLKKE